MNRGCAKGRCTALTHVRERSYEQNGNTAICLSHTFSMWKFPRVSVDANSSK
jgi:hypothetical protein